MKKTINMINHNVINLKKRLTVLLLPIFIIMVPLDSQSQQLELFSTSNSDLLSNGPKTTNGPAVFRSNTGRTTSSSSYSSNEISVTLSFSDQQYTSSSYPGLTSGSQTTTSSSTLGSMQAFNTIASLGAPSDHFFTSGASASAGTNFDVDYNYGFHVFVDAYYQRGASSSSRNYYGLMTLTFSRPVVNPVIHLSGMGGAYGSSSSGPFMGFYTEFELSDTDLTLSRLSGSTYFNVSDGTKILNSSTSYPGSLNGYTNTQYNASAGSVLINTGHSAITSVSFRVYLKGNGSSSGADWSSASRRSGDGFMVSASLDISTLNISGNVFDDGDGSFINPTEVVNIIPPGIFANLLDAAGIVIASVPVNTDGSYTFPTQADVLTSSYRVSLSSASGTAGSVPPLFSLPEDWTLTGSYNGPPNTGNSGLLDGYSEPININPGTNTISNINFGINKRPDSDDKILTISQPLVNDEFSLDGIAGHLPLMSGSDHEDGDYEGNEGANRHPAGVIITSLPDNGTLYYNGNEVMGSDVSDATIFSDPSLFTILLSGSGYTSVTFNYAYVDAAGMEDKTPAIYSISWEVPLPVSLLRFEAEKSGNTVLLTWITAREHNNKGFEIEKSIDGRNWSIIGFINSKAAGGHSTTQLNYSFTDNQPANGSNFYRLKQTDMTGKYEYSPVRIVDFTESSGISIYPNPAWDMIAIRGIEGQSLIELYDMSGQKLSSTQGTGDDCNLNISGLSEGVYLIRIRHTSGENSTYKVIKQK